MQKVTAFLEQHVQWLAIGLGALFCLFMIWSYVITPPAEVQVGSKTLGPSEVDPETADTVAQQLQTAMNNNRKIVMAVPQYVQAFQSTMTWQNAKPVELAGLIDPSLTKDVLMPEVPQQPQIPGQPQIAGQPPQPGQPAVPGQKITALPVPPTPLGNPDWVKYGRSVVIPPPAPGQAAAVPAPGVVPPEAYDEDWVTHMWTVSMGDLDAAFRKAGMQNVPLDLRKTMFLQVEMVREEMVDGKWGNETIVKFNGPMRNNQLMLPWPGDGVGPEMRQPQFQYMMWASTSTPDIIQPLFHVTMPGKGDQWTKPGQAIIGPGNVFNPAAHVGGRGNLDEAQWQQVLQYRREQYKLLQEQKQQNRGPRAPAVPGGRGGPPDMEGAMEGMYAPRQRSFAPARQLPHYAPAPGRYLPPRPMPPDMMEMEDGGMGGYGGYGGAAQAPGLPQPGQDYPQGEFDPSDAQPLPWKGKQVDVWAHDDTVEAGKTYRYKMRYKMKNPIFGAANISEPPALAEQFALISEFSDWTTPITVPSLVNFFVASSKAPGRNTVDFEIFRWDQGQQKLERFTVGPGDLVGWSKNGIDYSTEWTLVDFRDDPRANDTQILLVNNDDGSVVARSFKADQGDKLYRGLKDQVEAARKAEAAAAAAAGGVVPGANGTAAAR